MNTKSIALAIAFAAVAIALNVVKIPSLFYPGVPFQITQIPIVIAFLLFGWRIGVLVGIINLVGGLALFPMGPTGIIIYPMDLLSALIMFVGLYTANKFAPIIEKTNKPPIWKKPTIRLTTHTIAFRGGIMPFFDYGALHVLVPLVLGLYLPESNIIGLIPAFILYNVLVPLYTIPIAYTTATKVGKYLDIDLVSSDARRDSGSVAKRARQLGRRYFG